MINSFEGIHYKNSRPIRVTIEEGRIASVKELNQTSSSEIIAPGLVDLQVNGFEGVDFNEGELSVEDVVKVTEKLWQVGVTSYMPTLITNSDIAISNGIKKIGIACTDQLISDSILGIHLEGPFLSKENGPRGAHPLQYIKAPDWELVERWQNEAAGRINLLTISPEYENSADFIRKCIESNIQVAIGHTNANSAQVKAAVDAGARLSTHLGNAAHLSLPRHPNYIWDQLASDQLWSSIIADGFHLPDAVLKVFMKVKPEKTFLVSDSTKFAGLSPGIYQSPIGGSVELTSEGKLFMVDSPDLLAGSASSLKACLAYLVNSNQASASQAIEMASIQPRNFMTDTAHSSGIQVGDSADLILFEWKENSLDIKKTIKGGSVVFPNS